MSTGLADSLDFQPRYYRTFIPANSDDGIEALLIRPQAHITAPNLLPHQPFAEKAYLSKLIQNFGNQHSETYQIHSLRPVEVIPSFQSIALCSGSSNGPFNVA